MDTVDYAVRAWIVCVLLLTFLTTTTRAVLTEDPRARVGNAAFAALAGVGSFSQFPLWLADTPATVTTWLLAAASLVCIAYLITLTRKGLT